MKKAMYAISILSSLLIFGYDHIGHDKTRTI